MRQRPRRPVERVLQRTRDRGVVFRRRDQHGVCSFDLGPKRSDGLGAGVMSRSSSYAGTSVEPAPDDELDVGRAFGRGGVEQRGVVGATPEAAADRRGAASGLLTSSRCAVISTSQPRASLPSGRGSCQFRSQLRRSTVARSSRAARESPNGSVVGGANVPPAVTGRRHASDDELAGRRLALRSSPSSTLVERKEISG